LSNHESTTSDSIEQRQRMVDEIFREKLEQRRFKIQARIERKEQAKLAPVKMLLTVNPNTHARAELEALETHGCSLTEHIYARIKALAEAHQARAPFRRLKPDRPGYRFPKVEDRALQERIAYDLKSTEAMFPHGITMQELQKMTEINEYTRSMLTLIGRIMKNLGYRKERTYTPATADTPVKLGWIYRKQEQDTWSPPAA
jgi:hypothetical protein